jgi:TonB family protein
VSKKWQTLAVLVILLAPTIAPVRAWSQHQELPRKVKARVSPLYPDLARRMNISGTVRLQVVVGPDGSVRATNVLGGHPLLVQAAADAVRKWKFEPGAETTGVIEVKFSPASGTGT